MGIIVEDASLIGVGEVFVRSYQSQEALLSLGNTTGLKIAHSEDQKSLPNHMTGVGNRNTLSRVTGVQASFTLYDWNAKNLAIAGRGAVRGVAAGTVTDELHTCEAKEGELILFNDLPDMSQPVTVKTAADATLSPGSDYILSQHGIRLTAGTTATNAGLKVSYTRLKASVVEMLAAAQSELELYFAGLNAAQGDKAMTARLLRFKPTLAKEITLSGDDYAAFEISGELLTDARVTAPGLSQFYSLGLAG